MRTRSRFTRPFAAASPLLLTGCVGDLLVGGCILVGCVNGRSIALSRVPTEAYTVQLFVDEEAPREIRCPESNRCSGPAFFFENTLPTMATVVVTTAAADATLHCPRLTASAASPDTR